MNGGSSLDWPGIRSRAAQFPEEAFEFVRDGLKHTVARLHGKADGGGAPSQDRRHISGQQLCMGLRELSVKRYGLLARTVLSRWGVRGTEDFGTLVYAMIDRGELRSSPNDSIEDFRGVYDFDEAYSRAELG